MKALLVSLAIGVFAVAQVGTADAFSFAGEKCWRLNPFSEIVRLSIKKENNQYALHGVSAFGGLIQGFLTGTAVKSADEGTYKMGLMSVTPAGACYMYRGDLSIATGTSVLNSGFIKTCTSSGTASFTWTPVACPTGLVSELNGEAATD